MINGLPTRLAGWALTCVVCVLVLFRPYPGYAAPPLPPAATPGGAMPVPALGDLPLPPAPEAGAFPIPPVIDRPLDAESGDRVFVSEFKLKGAQDRPEQGIVAEELQAIIDELRIDKQRLKEVAEDGFTPAEKEEIAGFMRQVVDAQDLDMMFDQYQTLVDKLRIEKLARDAGMTIGQMQEVANAVTEYYRSKGFILAQAFVPAQEVEDGVVVIEVLEGKLGNVLAEGNERFSQELLAKPFGELIDAPITAESLESAILTVLDYPGLTAFAVMQPGVGVGSSDLVLKVQDEAPYALSLRLDNHGTYFSGKNRATADLAINNPTKSGDRFTASLLQQYNPKLSALWSAGYERPLFWPGSTAGVSYERNLFDVGHTLSGQGFSGETRELELWMRQAIIRGRQRNIYTRFGFRRTQSITRQFGTETNKDDLSMIQARVDFDSIDTATQAVNLASIEFLGGLGSQFGGNNREQAARQTVPPGRQGGSGTYASNEFYKLAGNYSRLQTLTENQSLLVRVEAQFTNSLLTSSEQYSMGGPGNVRAYPVSEFLRDRAVFASLEWIVNAPFFADQEAFGGHTWGEVLRVSFFMDYASGWLNDPIIGQDEAGLAILGSGVGAQFSIPGQFTSTLQWAHPMFVDRKTKPSDFQSGRWWLDLSYTF